MVGLLIFSLEKAINLVKSNNKLLKKKNILIITDKVAVFNYFKKNKYNQIECLDNYIRGNKKKLLLLKQYKYFEKYLLKVGLKNKIAIKGKLKNTIFNSFGHHSSRLYAGTIFLTSSLDKVYRKKNFKELIFLNDLKNEIFPKDFYFFLFDYYCNKKKIKFTTLSFRNSENIMINLFLKKIYNIYYYIKEINIKLLLIKTYKFFSNYIFILSKKENLVLEPAYDLDFAGLNPKKTVYIDIERIFLEQIKKIKNFELDKNLTKFKNEKDIIKFFILEMNKKMIKYHNDSINFFLKKISNLGIKRVFWGLAPNYLKRNLIKNLPKSIDVIGCQHGGSYFVTQKDDFHKNLEFSFCKNYYSYGVSKQFKTKKYFKKNNLILSGCLKEPYVTNRINENHLINNLLYIPVSLNNFWKPYLQSSQVERFTEQSKICREINNQKYFKPYFKILPKTMFQNFFFNYYNLQSNPIYLDIYKYKNLKVNSDSLMTSVKNVKPKVIISDFFSTPIYELCNSNSEIILFIDKLNLPKKDVLQCLEKRCFIANSPLDLKMLLKKIYEGSISKNSSKSFFNQFYKFKRKIG